MIPISLIASLRAGRPSSPEVIADVVRTLILRGHFQGGQPLRQDALAKWFDVSHIPVREGLRHLTAQGLVELRDKRGAVVAELQPDEAEEILEIRFTLEAKAVSLAMPKWSEETFQRLEENLKQAEASNSIDEWNDLNKMFHSELYQPCERPQLLALIGNLNAKVERYIRLLVSRSNYRDQAQQEHRAILASARIKNLPALAVLIEHHAVQTAVQLRHFLSSHASVQSNRSKRSL